MEHEGGYRAMSEGGGGPCLPDNWPTLHVTCTSEPASPALPMSACPRMTTTSLVRDVPTRAPNVMSFGWCSFNYTVAAAVRYVTTVSNPHRSAVPFHNRTPPRH